MFHFFALHQIMLMVHHLKINKGEGLPSVYCVCFIGASLKPIFKYSFVGEWKSWWSDSKASCNTEPQIFIESVHRLYTQLLRWRFIMQTLEW